MASRKAQTVLALPSPVDGAGQANNHDCLARGQQRKAGERSQIAIHEGADRWQRVGSSEEVSQLQREHVAEPDLNQPGELYTFRRNDSTS